VDQHGTGYCRICGQTLMALGTAFAISQSPVDDRLIIYHWNELSAQNGVYGACCAFHVRELVVHWMVTKNLNYPFADSKVDQTNSPPCQPSGETSSYALAAPIGELSVDHESISRVLAKQSSVSDRHPRRTQ
jgi:hypothetical protein